MAPDAVVIGSGPNGLVAANRLAEAGWEVLVLEAEPDPGGAVRSGEIVEPGFVSDRFSAFYPLAFASPVIRELGLEDFGLTWRRSPNPVAHPGRDGSCAYIGEDVEETAAGLEEFARGDGAAWKRLMALWEEIGDDVLAALFRPFPPVVPVARLARKLGGGDLIRLARFATLDVRRLGEENFSGDGGPRLLAGNALHADLSPETPPSGVYGWVLCGLAQNGGFPVPEGGSGGLTRAMVRRIESLGGEVRCDSPVERIELVGGRARAVRLESGERIEARRAILADVAAPHLYERMLDPAAVPQGVHDDLKRFEYGDSTFKVDWSLDGEVPWLAEPARRAGTIHVAEGVDALTQHSAELARGLLPDEPYLVLGQYAHFDPTRSPQGKDTVWAYTHTPQTISGDARGEIEGELTGEAAERFADRVEEQIEAVAPGFRDRVRARRISTPADLEASNRNLVGGAINGGTPHLNQQLIFRPVAGLGRAETPVRDLYLASASAHPGGGVHGACGANAAYAAMSRRNALAPALLRRLSGSGTERPL
ncbi:NAD(P)/FAD-dependent oxidoreductase [Thermoleophilia bacterium SCSIO 60948]|nr:NAD(P)/FAD-dependent oxidoreductase [Thermoleophilia bacterium SCSIO 60948]